MSLKSQIENDLISAMKSADKLTVSVLRMLKAEIKNREIENRSELDEDALIGAVSSKIKKGRESARLFEEGGRNELAEKEKQEIEILSKYLPEQMSEEELTEKVKAVIADIGATEMKQMGAVMKAVIAQVGKSADGSQVSKLVKELLQAKA